MKRLIVAAAILATLTASSVSAAPAPAPQKRICVAWQNTCIKSVYVFGIRYCTVHQFTCIRWM